MPHGVHAKDQVNVRFPPDVLARLKDGAKRHRQTITDIMLRGTVAELDRLDGLAEQAGKPPKTGDQQR